MGLWWTKSKNCGSCRGCGGHFWKNCAGVGVVIFGKIVLGLGLSSFGKFCWGWGCGALFIKNCAVVVVVVFIFKKLWLWLGLW